MTRLKLAEPTSGIGARVLGVGLGALFPQWFALGAGLIAFAGVITRALGRWDKHRLEVQHHAEGGPLVVALYGVCWLLLGGVLVSVLVAR